MYWWSGERGPGAGECEPGAGSWGLGTSGEDGARASALMGRPQWSQKRAASGSSVVQKGQSGSSQNPHRLQKRAEARLSVWQLEQITVPL